METTAEQIVERARTKYPDLKFAISRNELWIGAWSETVKRYIAVCGKTLMNTWVDCPFGLLADGKPVVADADWLPVAR